MAHCDYLVSTVAVDDHVQALEPRLMHQVEGGKVIGLHGYRVTMREKAGYGYSRDGSRLMIVGTGTGADRAMAMLSLFDGCSISIARIDLQDTVAVDDPDRVIAFTSPRPSYRASRWTAVGEPGETLYVGAPKSDARLRLYNKTAESGLSPGEGLQYLRVEVQLRNRYADQAYRQIRKGGSEEVLIAWVQRMLMPSDADYVKKLIGYHSVAALLRLDEREEDWIARRKMWIERSVVPSIKRLLVAEPGYKETLIALIEGIDIGSDRD